MAGRIRSIKPELLEDAATANLDDTEFRAFVSFLLLADDYGNFRADPKQLEGAIWWAYDEEKHDWVYLRARLAKLVLFWEGEDGQLYGHVRTWARHQRVDKPGKPRCPKPTEEALAKPIPPIPPRRPRRPAGAQETTANSQIRESLANVSRVSPETPANSPSTVHDRTGADSPKIQQTPPISQIRESLATDLRSPISDQRPPTSDTRERDVVETLRVELGDRFDLIPDPAACALKLLQLARVDSGPDIRGRVITRAAQEVAKAKNPRSVEALLISRVEALRAPGVLDRLDAAERKAANAPVQAEPYSFGKRDETW